MQIIYTYIYPAVLDAILLKAPDNYLSLKSNELSTTTIPPCYSQQERQYPEWSQLFQSCGLSLMISRNYKMIGKITTQMWIHSENGCARKTDQTEEVIGRVPWK